MLWYHLLLDWPFSITPPIYNNLDCDSETTQLYSLAPGVSWDHPYSRYNLTIITVGASENLHSKISLTGYPAKEKPVSIYAS